MGELLRLPETKAAISYLKWLMGTLASLDFVPAPSSFSFSVKMEMDVDEDEVRIGQGVVQNCALKKKKAFGC